MTRICTIEGCGKPRVGWGYCTMHYRRNKRHGDPLALAKVRSGETQVYFETTVLPYAGNDCLIWPYFRDVGGYGRIQRNGKSVIVSRLVCEITHGPPPTPKHQAAHSCGNGMAGCVTSSHLRWATPAENTHEKYSHGTMLRGEKIPNAKLTDSQAKEIRALAGILSNRKTARLFGVGATAVRYIRQGKRWAHTLDPQEQEVKR